MRPDGPVRRLAAALMFAALAAACAPGDERAIRDILDSDRRAHLECDAARLVSNLADTLISVDGGRIRRQGRDEVERMFRAYFANATYHAWDDVEPPRVRVAPGGRMAWVLRRVHVEREQPGPGGDTLRRAFTSAWAATYEKRGGRWRMTTVTSTVEPEPTRADRLLEAARRHLGDGSPRALAARARATGPSGRFAVTVRSARDGRVRIDFDGGFSAAVGAEARWMRTSAGAATLPLGRDLESFVRGHEVHMNLIAPETRYGTLSVSGAETLAGRPAWTLTGFDALDRPVTFFYARDDSLPLGYRVEDHATGRGPVTVSYEDWRTAGSARLPHRAVFRQGAEVHTYDFVAIALDPALPDSLFSR